MRRALIIIIVLLVQVFTLKAQYFSALDTLQLPGLAAPVFEWLDADNDGRLDILITGRDLTVTDSSRSVSYIYHQQPDTTFLLVNIDLATYGTQVVRLADLNQDGRQDLLVASTDGVRFEHLLYENTGALSFAKSDISRPEFERWDRLRLADLDNDGRPELLTYGEGGFILYKNITGSYIPVDLRPDLNEIKTAPVILDFDKDGFLDIYLAGTLQNGDSVAYMLYNQKELSFIVRSFESDPLEITDYVVSDFNGDGLPDLLASHDINDDSRALELLLNVNGARFEPAEDDTLVRFNRAKVFAADLSSDGILDTDVEGLTIGASGSLLARERFITTPDTTISQRDTLANSSGQGRRYGDLDFDGDLDYFEVSRSPRGSVLWLFNNDQEIVNQGPAPLQDLLQFRFQNTLYLVWNTATDDFTTSPSVTYDVSIGTGPGMADVLAGGFDPESLKRTVSGPGNQGSNRFLILNNPPIQPVSLAIMPIDNAFHYDVSSCLVGSTTSCGEELMVQEKVLCSTNSILLATETGEEASWFSAAEGYLGTAAQLNFVTSQRDFVIAVYDRVGGCIDGEIFEIIPDPALQSFSDLIICPEAIVNLEAEGVWDSIRWTSQLSGVVSERNVLNFQPAGDDIITVDVLSPRGCRFQQTFSITVDEVIASVQDSLLMINEGERIQLFASGGTQYRWTPEVGLSQTDIANPFANPSETTVYTVEVFNETGCLDATSVTVQVHQTAFVPDMFTPNGDGRNDTFIIYDLERATTFRFTILDRAGNLVFESTSWNEMFVRGWDGNKGSEEQPTGNYFWRVSGTYEDGQVITINGKKSGAFQLIR